MDARIDMAIPDSFHRVKRTMMLLSTALVVLAWAVPDSRTTLKVGYFDSELNTKVVGWLLLAALAYYSAGFYLEIRTAQRVNTGLFDEGLGSLKDASTGLSHRLRVAADRLEIFDGHPDIAALQHGLERLEPEVAAVNSKISGISKTIAGHRKVGFWGWDVAGAYTFAAFAAFIYLSAIGPPAFMTASGIPTMRESPPPR